MNSGAKHVPSYVTRNPNEYVQINNDFGAIILIHRGLEIPTLIDHEDSDRVLRRRWCLNTNGYAQSSHPIPKIYLHRYVLEGEEIDHINHCRLDNRKCNLRLATTAQNQANRGVSVNRIGVKGVRLLPSGRYAAQMKAQGKQIHIGVFDTIEEASYAYYETSRQFFGEYACQ